MKDYRVLLPKFQFQKEKREREREEMTHTHTHTSSSTSISVINMTDEINDEKMKMKMKMLHEREKDADEFQFKSKKKFLFFPIHQSPPCTVILRIDKNQPGFRWLPSLCPIWSTIWFIPSWVQVLSLSHSMIQWTAGNNSFSFRFLYGISIGSSELHLMK